MANVIQEVHNDYRDVELGHMYVDNAAMQLIRAPKQFDTIVTTNMFGDILSDAAAMITGSIGMLPSASLGGKVGLYEPVHGSAPDIYGKDIANPIGMILSIALFIEYGLGGIEQAAGLRNATEETLSKGIRTPDIGGVSSSQVVTDAIINEMSSSWV